MRLRHWRVKTLFCLLGLFCLYYVYIFVFEPCSNTETKRKINELCALYLAGTLSGDLCEPLCKDYEVRLVKCIQSGRGKQVITARWGDVEIVLKAKSFNITEYENDWKNAYDAENLDSYRKSVLVTLKENHGVNVPEKEQEMILDKIWSARFNWKESSKVSVQAAMRSLWSLVSQDEFALMQYFQGFAHVPRIYGTCGFLYAVKSIPQSQVFSINPLQNYRQSWSDRVRLALAFLELVENLDTEFPEPMHLCDVQPSNFGYLPEPIDPGSASQHPVVSLLDIDAVFTETYVKTMMSSKCRGDDDCNFFDCMGRCQSNGVCSGSRINNNLQSICKDIFLSSWETGYLGLLSNPPAAVKQELEAVLQSCVNPALPHASLRTPKETLIKIRAILRNSYAV